MGTFFSHPAILRAPPYLTVSFSNKIEGSTIEPTKKLTYIKGLRAAYKTLGATQRDQYSWVAKTDKSFVFTAEIDHIDKDDNIYNHKNGTFHKKIRPLSVSDGEAALTVSHALELYSAINQAFEAGMKCRLLLLKGTKYGTSKGGVKAAVDGDYWVVEKISGSVAAGFEFILVRTTR